MAKDRDPRNPAHVAAALNAITQKVNADNAISGVTPKTRAELAQLGIKTKLETFKPAIDDSVVVCAFYFLDQGLMLADNLLGEDCRAAIQYRPHMSGFKTRLCCFCTLDRITK